MASLIKGQRSGVALTIASISAGVADAGGFERLQETRGTKRGHSSFPCTAGPGAVRCPQAPQWTFLSRTVTGEWRARRGQSGLEAARHGGALSPGASTQAPRKAESPLFLVPTRTPEGYVKKP